MFGRPGLSKTIDLYLRDKPFRVRIPDEQPKTVIWNVGSEARRTAGIRCAWGRAHEPGDRVRPDYGDAKLGRRQPQDGGILRDPVAGDTGSEANSFSRRNSYRDCSACFARKDIRASRRRTRWWCAPTCSAPPRWMCST